MRRDTINMINAYGTKSITLDQYPPEAWDFLSGDPDGDSDSVKAMWEVVPWLYAGVNIIAQSCAEVPIGLYRGDTEITSNEDWDATLAPLFLPDVNKLVRKLAASITLEGQGYLFRDDAATVNATKRLVFWNPTTVKVDWDRTKSSRRLWFKRTVNGIIDYYTEDEVIHFWPDDGYTELGPPYSSPAKAALAAAGVLHNADRFIQAYWQRGAIRAMILSVEGNPSKDERDKLLAWWKSITGGVKKAFEVFTFNAKAVSPVMVGDGLEGLQNTALTTEKREDISTALGVPQSILFSTNAGGLGGAGVVTGDRVNLYELTVIPLVKLICENLNRQQLDPLGYRLVVNENEMAMYQEDETARTSALSQIVSALANPEEFLLSADIVGLELSKETIAAIQAMIAKKAENAAIIKEQMKPNPDNATPTDTTTPQDTPPVDNNAPANNMPMDNTPKSLPYQADLNRWRRKALKAGGWCEFVSETIPDEIHANITERLKVATSEDAIKAAFEFEIRQPERNESYIQNLADAIRAATAAIQTTGD